MNSIQPSWAENRGEVIKLPVFAPGMGEPSSFMDRGEPAGTPKDHMLLPITPYYENEHGKLYHGDCLEVMEWMAEQGQTVDMVLTDPPYLIAYKTSHRKDNCHEFCSVIEGDNDPGLIADAIRGLFRIIKNNRAAYIFCHFDTIEFFKREVERHAVIKNGIIWVKNNWSAGDLEYAFGRQYEILLLCNKGRKKFNGKRISDVWYFRRAVGPKQLHQNQKPMELISQCIRKHSDPNDIVFDPFAGSGTTAVAAQRLGRRWILVEIEEKYCEIITKRLSDSLPLLENING